MTHRSQSTACCNRGYPRMGVELDRILIRSMALRVGKQLDHFYFDLDEHEVYRRWERVGERRVAAIEREHDRSAAFAEAALRQTGTSDKGDRTSEGRPLRGQRRRSPRGAHSDVSALPKPPERDRTPLGLSPCPPHLDKPYGDTSESLIFQRVSARCRSTARGARCVGRMAYLTEALLGEAQDGERFGKWARGGTTVETLILIRGSIRCCSHLCAGDMGLLPEVSCARLRPTGPFIPLSSRCDPWKELG